MGRAGIFAGVGVLATVNALADQIIGQTDLPIISRIMTLGGVSAVIWFAIYAILQIGLQTEQDQPRSADGLMVLAVVAASLVPTSSAARAGLLICAVYAFATSQPTEPLRRVALVLLALTGTLVWGPLLMTLLAKPILALDANIVGRVIGSPVNVNIVHFAGSDRAYVIAMGCSSINNISLAIVLWGTAVSLFDLEIDWPLVAIGAGMVAVTFFLNIVRLSAIGLFPAHFDSLHVGDGAALFGLAGLIAMGLLAGLGVTNAVARQR